MTDDKFQQLIIKCRKTGDRYKELLKKAEEEYKKRYGNYPSDVDDDGWIDALHYFSGDISLSKIEESAREANDMN